MVLKQHTRPGSNLKESALVPPNNEGAEDSHTLKSIFFLGWPSSKGMSEPKTCKEPCYVSAGLEIPQKSPLFIKAVKDDEFISTMNWSQFNSKFENLAIGAPLAIKERFSIDTWTDILDYVESPNDLYSLALTSRTLYNLALPHLYKSISIRSPLFVHEVTTGEKLIPIDHLLEPISPPPVYRYVSNKVGARPPFEKRRRIELPGAHHDHCGQPSTITMYKKPHLLRYVRELRIEKWEAQRVVIASDSPPQFGKEFNLYEAGEFGPEGVKDLMWRPEGCLSYHSLSGTLVDLLKSMPMLEKFRYAKSPSYTF